MVRAVVGYYVCPLIQLAATLVNAHVKKKKKLSIQVKLLSNQAL